MATTSSLNQSMEKAVQHYSSLFKLPSYKIMLLLQALICAGNVFLSIAIISPRHEGLFSGIFMGVGLFLASLLADYSVNMLILRQEPIYDLRRITGLSLFSWSFWLLFNFVGAAVAAVFGLSWWIRLCLLGFSAAIILRSIVLFSTSPAHYRHLFAASILQPFLCIIPFLVFWAGIGYSVNIQMGFFFVFSPIISLFSSFLFIRSLNRAGMHTLGIRSIPLFKAFLLNWITDLNAPFEEFLEKLGENQNVEASLIEFSSSKPKALIAVPSIHPGPFKNIGSSLLPSMLKTALEKKFSCDVCVPHGLLGHEFDLASQTQTQKVINHIVDFADFEIFEIKASPFIKVSNGLATACCQLFGSFAFLSFTLSPETTEDLPQELEIFAREESEKYGLNCCIVVNAHNSIDGTMITREALTALKEVTADCLRKTVSLKHLPFDVGSATVIPKEFSLKEGMGSGGITTLIIRVGEQKTAYVIIDGNNMVSGLRENILSALNSMGIDEGEVFTTDTHSVNAMILGNRGYHPVGEVMRHETLIGYIEEAVSMAVSNLERVKAACNTIKISNIKVIGEKQLEMLCLLIDETLQKAKKTIIPILSLSGLLLMFILMFV